MAVSTKILLGAIALLMIDSIIELSFITSMVSWLHFRAGTAFRLVGGPTGTFSLKGKPMGLLVDQGHTSNGAAGAAFVVVGLGGLLVLFLRSHQLKRSGNLHGFVRGLYTFWLYFTVVSAVFSIAALIYVQTVTAMHAGQQIDLQVALANAPFSTPYPNGYWTPQNWFTAMLEYPFASETARKDVQFHLTIMKGWQWNIIPMAILGIVVAVLAWMNRERNTRQVSAAEEKVKDMETGSQ